MNVDMLEWKGGKKGESSEKKWEIENIVAREFLNVRNKGVRVKGGLGRKVRCERLSDVYHDKLFFYILC